MQKEIINLKAGDLIDHLFLLRKIELKKTRTNNDYLDLEFSDKTGNIGAKFWENFEEFKSYAFNGMIAKVKGIVKSFNGALQIEVSSAEKFYGENEQALEGLIKKAPRNFDLMKNELTERIEKIQNSYLKRLLQIILKGKRYESFVNKPAGKSWHHSYLHGLLEHTLEIIKICDLMCDIYPDLNRDLLITGAILHDYGKTQELSSTADFNYTDKGRLIGHIVIAAIEIEKAASRIEWFPEELKNQLLHLVLSHQGKLEFASPVEPKTLEAIVLYHADELSAKTNAYKNAIQSDITEGNWTKFIRLANTNLYKNRDFEETNNQGE